MREHRAHISGLTAIEEARLRGKLSSRIEEQVHKLRGAIGAAA